MTLSQLSALAAAATPGERHADHYSRAIRTVANMRGDDGREPFVIARWPHRDASSPVPHEEWMANADLAAACSPEVIAALVRVAEAATRWNEAAERLDADALHHAAIGLRNALSALESVTKEAIMSTETI